jgi:RepB DNA-primase from phage plasmid/Primase C terminal 2 (PriCT-2)
MSDTSPPEVQTQAFLRMLDRSAKTFSFRVFSEKAKEAGSARNYSGKIDQVRQSLQQKNKLGCGVFVAVNAGGHRADEITRVRAVFADTDGAPREPIEAALAPHIIVESSPNRWHVYWLVKPDFPLSEFGTVQTAIAEKFGTDPSVKDLPRVMRVPGFYHRKREPFLCRLVGLNSKLDRYSLDDLVTGLGLDLNKPVKGISVQETNTGVRQQADFEAVERALSYLNPFVPRDEWLGSILALAHRFGEDGRALAHRWSCGDLWKGGRDGHA